MKRSDGDMSLDELLEMRNDTIEQCAKVAEKHLAETDSYLDGNAIAAAIRALKDRP